MALCIDAGGCATGRDGIRPGKGEPCMAEESKPVDRAPDNYVMRLFERPIQVRSFIMTAIPVSHFLRLSGSTA